MKKKYEIDWYSFIGFIGFAILTVAIWRIPIGYYVMYPFTIIGTWFHEMGHGIMAWILGGKFLYLEIFPNGSGLAHSSHSEFHINYNTARGLISLAGLMGPPFMGAIIILLSKSVRKSTVALYVLSVAMIISVIVWVRTPVGITVISLMAILFLLIAIKGGKSFRQFVVQIIGLQACVSTYLQIDYLFMTEVTVNGEGGLSDSGNIAQHWGMTVPFWGTFISILSFTLLLFALYFRNRRKIKVD